MVSVPRAQIAPEDTAFVKIDTDGFDYTIINGALQWLHEVMPLWLWEVDIRNEDDLREADSVVDRLSGIGYGTFVVWDDPGDLIMPTTDVAAVQSLHRYLLRQRSVQTPRIYNHDVLAVPKDRDMIVARILANPCRADGNSAGMGRPIGPEPTARHVAQSD